jgi:hypothetical protein
MPAAQQRLKQSSMPYSAACWHRGKGGSRHRRRLGCRCPGGRGSWKVLSRVRRCLGQYCTHDRLLSNTDCSMFLPFAVQHCRVVVQKGSLPICVPKVHLTWVLVICTGGSPAAATIVHSPTTGPRTDRTWRRVSRAAGFPCDGLRTRLGLHQRRRKAAADGQPSAGSAPCRAARAAVPVVRPDRGAQGSQT